jgi:glutathione S-transferase
METTMITLCGTPISNYYNKVKLALLEKGVAFTEELVPTGRTDEPVLSASPLGKIPFVRTEHGTMCESQAILDWLEAAHPTPPLLPADPWAAAKVHELTTFIDLHLELVVRELYAKAFWGGSISDERAARVHKLLVRNIAGFKHLAKFTPYVAGDTFTQADCAAYASLPLLSLSTKLVYGEDLLAAGGIDWKPYSQLVGARPSAQKMVADRKAAQAPKA